MPARLRDILRAVHALGGRHEVPSSGSHWKIYRDTLMYPLPAHNGERSEISDKYIRSMCRSLGFDEALLRKKL